MIQWKEVKNEEQFEKGKEYLFTDGERILTASFNTPYSGKSDKIWFSASTKGYVTFKFSHYAEINLPEVSK